MIRSESTDLLTKHTINKLSNLSETSFVCSSDVTAEGGVTKGSDADDLQPQTTAVKIFSSKRSKDLESTGQV